MLCKFVDLGKKHAYKFKNRWCNLLVYLFGVLFFYEPTQSKRTLA